MVHPDEGTIHAWLDGALSVEESDTLRAHVEACELCSTAVAEARGFIAASTRILTALDDTPGDVLPALPDTRIPAGNVRRWRPALAAAATVLLMLSGGLYVVNRVPRSNPFTDSVALTREIATAADTVSRTSELQQAPAATVPMGIVGNTAGSASIDRSTARDQSAAVASANVDSVGRGAATRLARTAGDAQDSTSSASLTKSAAKADVAAVPPTLPVTPPVPPPTSVGAATGLVAEQMQRAPQRAAEQTSRDSVGLRMQRAAPAIERARTSNQGASFAATPSAPSTTLAGCYEVTQRAGGERLPARMRLTDSSIVMQDGSRRNTAIALDDSTGNSRTYQWQPLSGALLRIFMVQGNVSRNVDAATDLSSPATVHIKRVACP